MGRRPQGVTDSTTKAIAREVHEMEEVKHSKRSKPRAITVAPHNSKQLDSAYDSMVMQKYYPGT